MHRNLLINFSCSSSPFLSPFTAIDISLSLSALVCIRLFIVYIVFFNSVFAMWMQLPDKQTMFFQCSTRLFPLTLFYINVIYLPLICHILTWRRLTYHIPSILIVFLTHNTTSTTHIHSPLILRNINSLFGSFSLEKSDW